MKMLLLLVLLLAVCGDSKMVDNFISPQNSAINYYGRFDFTDPEVPQFDWTGVYIEIKFQGTSCKVILTGKCRYDIFIDNKFSSILTVNDQKDTFTIAEKLVNATHTLRIAKRTETNLYTCKFYGFILDDRCTLEKITDVKSRKIEFIGDSYTAGYCNEYPARECQSDSCDALFFLTTNTNKAFGALLGQSFNAQYQINAYSGRGLVRNYNGFDRGKEFLFFYDYTLNSKAIQNGREGKWDFSRWHPDIVVIGLGINDFLADPPYADSTQFDAVYGSFLDFLRKKHPGVKIICCATDVWPTHALIPRIKHIVEKQKKANKDDIWYFEYITENTALYGHPSIEDHKKIAKELQPLIANISQWNFTSIE